MINAQKISDDMSRFGISITESEEEVVVIKPYTDPPRIRLKDVSLETELLTDRLSLGLNDPNFVAQLMLWKNQPVHKSAHIHKIEDVVFGSLAYARIIYSFERK